MKTERMNLGALFTLAAAGMLVCADLAYAQAAPAEKKPATEKQVIESPGDRPIALHRVGEKSSAVNLTVVGKEVSPGIFQVDPNAISDKRLVIDGKAKRVCLGKWITTKKGPLCEGSWVEGI